MHDHFTYMRRCMELAGRGIGSAAPNPMVGAVLVHQDRIIGEGYHEAYGKAHAEVNCINSVVAEDIALIPESTLYISLEPCNHHGKTPPCTDLIIKNKIPRIITGCADSFEQNTGGGLEKLIAAGVTAESNILRDECRSLNKRFFTFNEKKRPYIILKWAQSADGKIAGEGGRRVKISNNYTDKLVHKWRSEEAAILVGTNTVLNDNPALTVRKWPGKNLMRVVIDLRLQLSSAAKILDDTAPTLIINREKSEIAGSDIYRKISDTENVAQASVRCIYEQQLNSVIIEGGSKTLQSFIDIGLWDEARVITNTGLQIKKGIGAPCLKDEILMKTTDLFSDTIASYKHKKNEFL